ncbi:MAG: DUF6494 family protein [Neomegalonema sp.]|nr:DUF6494 family protein [Neomegalonema sp.]
MSDHAFDAEALNMSMRKFLKQLGVTSQQEIEAAIRAAAGTGALAGDKLAVKAVVTIEAIGLEHVVDGEIALKSGEGA